ncbi:17-beta-hydroxysteroid dehydrogenase 13-like isoform X2 [Spea bombifrons]|uniref:17-beta-hydroxysteroid dehydrogenase 13-like isoform X2 n=1 Tax=Spea bombifrons TaxID=233779 RepID=UPI00234B9CC4|nr:17-beta-hydroxysteroid dehydrogenase 13-like isoform X2 [Spea bombifrons]
MNIILDYLLLFAIAIYSFLESFVKLFIPVKGKSVSGNIVLITGAGHGMGRLTAYEFAKRQSILVLWDINKQGVEETAEECRQLGAIAHAFVVDCSNRCKIYSAAEKVKKEIGDVDILINNAGVIFGAELLQLHDHQIETTFDVNILAHFWTAKSFLPAMMKKNRGHIVTVASIAGHVGLCYLVDYCASKFGAVGFHECLTAELEALGKNGIKTSCLCPVFVNTGFVQNPSTRFLPERVIAKLNKMQEVEFYTPLRTKKECSEKQKTF